MKIEVDLKKRYFLVIIGAILILGGIFAVSAVYPVFGHTKGEIDNFCGEVGACGSTGSCTTCTTAGSINGYIMNQDLRKSDTPAFTSQELRWDGGTPYIDFSNDATSDNDMRIIYTPDKLTITGGFLEIDGPLKAVSVQGMTIGNTNYGAAVRILGDKLEVKSFDANIWQPVYASGFLISSDSRAKKNIQPMIDNLDKVLALNPVRFDYKIESTSVNGKNIGLIAQEAEKIIPEIILTNNDAEGMKSIDYSKLTPVLIGAIQEQQLQINELKARIAELEAEN